MDASLIKTANTITALSLSASAAGVLVGMYIAYKKDKGFWGYAGYMLLGSIAGGLIVGVPGYIIYARKMNNKI